MEPTLDQLDTVADLLLEVADAEILPHFRKISPDEVRTKSSAIDWVTAADEAAERALRPRLLELFPAAQIVGEEAVAQDESLLDAISQPGLVILVDPIDGTRNFASGLSLFGVMVAFVSNGKLLASVICDPICRDWAIARRGDGAWIRHSDGHKQMLRAAAPRSVAHMEGCGLWLYMPEEQRANLASRLTTFASNAAYRCAAQEYRLIAGGHYDFALYHKLSPWDHAPGVLLHEEAGGYCAHFDGQPYDPRRRDGGLLCAADRASWQAIHDALQLTSTRSGSTAGVPAP